MQKVKAQRAQDREQQQRDGGRTQTAGSCCSTASLHFFRSSAGCFAEHIVIRVLFVLVLAGSMLWNRTLQYIAVEAWSVMGGRYNLGADVFIHELLDLARIRRVEVLDGVLKKKADLRGQPRSTRSNASLAETFCLTCSCPARSLHFSQTAGVLSAEESMRCGADSTTLASGTA